MGKKSGPTPPDPVRTANAQTALNKETALAQRDLNAIDQITPYGNLTYTKGGGQWDQAGFDAANQQYQSALDAWNQSPQGGQFGFGLPGDLQGAFRSVAGTPKPEAPKKEDFGFDPLKMTATTTLSDDQQRMLDLGNQAAIKFGEIGTSQLDKVGQKFEQPFDTSGLGPMPTADEQTRIASRDAILNRMNPIWNQDEERMRTTLANKGISEGSEAWRREMDDFNRMKTDARLAADQYAGNEMARTFGMGMQGRNQGLNEMQLDRSIPLNELVALTQGQQVQNPNFVNTPQGAINPGDLQGATYQSYNAQLQNQARKDQMMQAAMGGLATMGGAYLGGPAMFAGGGSGFAGGGTAPGGFGLGGVTMGGSPFPSGNSIFIR